MKQAIHPKKAGLEREIRGSVKAKSTFYEGLNIDELTGHAPGEFPRTLDGWAAQIHPADLDRFMSAVDGQLKDDTQYAVEYRVRSKDGNYSTWNARGTVLRHTDGQARKWIGAITDITERRKAEESLRLKNQVFEDSIAALSIADAIRKLSEEQQLIFDSVASSIWYKDTENRFLRVNRAGAESVGMAVKNIEGKSAYELFPDEAEKYLQDDLEVIRSVKPKLGIVERLQTAAGDLRWVRTDKVPTKDASGNCTGLVVFVTDITEQMQAREKIERSNIELAAANKELEAFAYSVSHDLRAPLRGIDGFSKALLDDYHDKLDDTGKDYIHRVRAGTQRMGILIDDMLKLSRLTRAEMVHERVELSDLAAKIADELQRENPGRLVEFAIAPGITVRGDRALLEAALDNLLRNSWKFTGRQDDARIELGVTEQNGETVYYVRDNGAGFDMAYADKLFGAFQRLHNATEFPGSGIGLAIVNRVVLRHGGRIWAEGEVGNGATFYFTLRIASPKQDKGV